MKLAKALVVLTSSIVLAVGSYFTFIYTRPGVIAPPQIQSDVLSDRPVTVKTPLTGWPASWKDSGVVTCLCTNHGEDYTNINRFNLFVNVIFWSGFLVIIFITYSLLKDSKSRK